MDMRYLVLIALLYSQDASTDMQEVRLGSVSPAFIGAPCSLKSDYVNGKCLKIKVRRKPRIRK